MQNSHRCRRLGTGRSSQPPSSLRENYASPTYYQGKSSRRTGHRPPALANIRRASASKQKSSRACVHRVPTPSLLIQLVGHSGRHQDILLCSASILPIKSSRPPPPPSHHIKRSRTRRPRLPRYPLAHISRKPFLFPQTYPHSPIPCRASSHLTTPGFSCERTSSHR